MELTYLDGAIPGFLNAFMVLNSVNAFEQALHAKVQMLFADISLEKFLADLFGLNTLTPRICRQ